MNIFTIFINFWLNLMIYLAIVFDECYRLSIPKAKLKDYIDSFFLKFPTLLLNFHTEFLSSSSFLSMSFLIIDCLHCQLLFVLY